MTYGKASEFQNKNRILVSTLAAYGNREVPIGFEWLKQSCDKFGIELTILGWGTQFTNMYDSKLEYVGYEIFQRRNNYDYVMNIDSADTLFLRELSSGDFNFNKTTFCAERNEFPLEQLRQPIIDKNLTYSSYKFLNAGAYCGTMNDVLKTYAYQKYKRWILQNIPEMTYGTCTTFSDDQAAFNLDFYNEMVDIDSMCFTFQSLWGVQIEKDVVIRNGELVNLEHSTLPLLLHANGSANYEEYYKQIILT